jgi:hypothetical protein
MIEQTTKPHAKRATMKRFTAGLLMPFGALAITAILLLGAGSVAAAAPPPETSYTLGTLPLLDAIAVNSTDVFAQGVTNCTQIYAVNTSGAMSVYASIPLGANVTCDEGALALVPAVPPCPCECSGAPVAPETLYDIVGGYLYAITNGGATVTLVHHFYVNPTVKENLGLTYDQVGLFQHDLIVTTSEGGKVWTYNTTTGNVSLVTQLYTYIGGPVIAPLTFGKFAGDIIIADKRLGEVVAVNPWGSVLNITNWSKPNAVTFPPGPTASGFGPNHLVLFVANYTSGGIEGFPASDMTNFTGQGFLAGGLNQGIASFTAKGVNTPFELQTQKLSFITSFA